MKIVRFPKSEPFLLSFVEQHREHSEGIIIIWDGAKAVFLTGEKAVPLSHQKQLLLIKTPPHEALAPAKEHSPFICGVKRTTTA